MRLTQIPHDRQARPRPPRFHLSGKTSDTGDTFPGILKIASAGSTGTDRGRTPRSGDHKDHGDPWEFGDPREFWGYLLLPAGHRQVAGVGRIDPGSPVGMTLPCGAGQTRAGPVAVADIWPRRDI